MREQSYATFEAMEIELDDHESQMHWTLMLRKDLTIGSKRLFKQKRFPNRTLNKHKAHLCAHGVQQTWGQNYWDHMLQL